MVTFFNTTYFWTTHCLCCLQSCKIKTVTLCFSSPALCRTHLPKSLTPQQASALSELMIGTAGCEPQPGACDCRWKTAYWSTLRADRNHYRQTMLIGLKIAMIFSFDRAHFVTGQTALHCVHTADPSFFCYLYFSCIFVINTTANRASIWHTMCMRYDSEWQYSESHIVKHPASLRVGSIWACVWITLSNTVHWFGISLCQLLVCRHKCLSAGC